MSEENKKKKNIEYISISSLEIFAKNSRTHSDEQIKQIERSIKEFGFTNPVLVDEKNMIIAGHGRVEAAKKAGMSDVPCLRLENLSSAQKSAYVIADNKIALNAGWDSDLLKLEIESLRDLDFDISLIGFNDDELAEIFAVDAQQDVLCDEDNVPKVTQDPVTRYGDIWVLGDHRLMCGDSTSVDNVDKLMGKEKCDLGFCDPPYNLGFEYNSYDDNKSDQEYRDFSKEWFSNLKIYTDRQIVTLGTKNIQIMANLDSVAGVACWVKKNWITSCHIAKLQQWEPIFFYGDYTKFKRTSDLFEINRVIQKDVGKNHTCPKQIDLIVDILEHYSEKSVLDLFGGSGTTMIAAEKTGRKSRLIELDPVYCDVIIKRWQEYTGKHAIHEQTKKTFNEMI